MQLKKIKELMAVVKDEPEDEYFRILKAALHGGAECNKHIGRMTLEEFNAKFIKAAA